MTLEILVLLLVAATLVIAGTSLYSVRRLKGRISEIEDAPAIAGSIGHSVPLQKVAMVVNPSKLGASDAILAVKAACAGVGFSEPLILETTVEDPGHAMTVEALEKGCTLVIAAGGDGTVREVAEVLAGTGATMALLPLGTGNLLARNLDFNVEDMDNALRVALHGRSRSIDAVRIVLERTDGSTGENVFLVMAGIGFDADMMSDTNDDLKAKVGPLAYAEAGMRHLPGQRRNVTISIDDGPEQTRKIRSVIVANCGKLQGGLDLVPDAVVDDGKLDLVVMSPRSVVGWVWIAAKTALRHRRGIPVIDYYQARKVRISAADPISSQLDGDTTGDVTALTVEVLPKALSIRVP
ncbi:diacylglycerol/lipid kinase family protein [Arthrobacter sp. KK5.5]|uniref:diacylglycerol/lipid kinase family protein n=1 Tax=Arthrobacter sp. KK5.5 TaxID=3373084 RepID=UPI003EE78445